MEEKQYTKAHKVTMLNRRTGTITGVLDVIITDSKPSLPGLVSQYVCTNKAAFICHPNSKLHPLLEAEHPVLQLQDLENMPMLLRDEGNTSRLQFDSLMLANNVNFFCKGVFTSYEGIFSAVDRDLGIGLATDRSSSAAAQVNILNTEPGI